jgi:hypothetical protein
MGARDEPGLLGLSRVASVVGGLFWVCLATVFVYADSALDQPGTAESGLAVSSMWLVSVVSLLLLLLGLWQYSGVPYKQALSERCI